MTITNLFIVLNLGCEMLYVIDQRLKAQTIPLDKSAQVLREITEVLLDPKFLHYISTAYQRNMLTVQQTRILLTDIACCSLMRLDALMDLTFRHLDGIGRLIPEMRKQIMIDNVKKSLIEMWEPLCEDDQIIIHRRVYKWLKPYATKISILIRMGLQKQDGEFETQLHNNVFYNYYINNIGENIYAKTANIQDLKEQVDQSGKGSVTSDQQPIESHEIDTLVQQLNIQHNTNETPEPEMHATDLQRSNSVHTALHEIIINQNEATESKADGPTTSDESNLVKFMKKIKMETDELAVMQVNAKNLNEELLKMFEQKID
ncbi:protein OSCP1 isoform X2 [Topomyia yanbarensis]|uniref:protein OSCP1 isoform X2 n=1 Tax=Topomyia yanbarensis TaxID=2498891 RepID=UPI00273AE994|nr:protein OSCP1 isoform X2 [Topomyia yanbarensis]